MNKCKNVKISLYQSEWKTLMVEILKTVIMSSNDELVQTLN